MEEKCNIVKSNDELNYTHVDKVLNNHKFKQVQTYLGDPVLEGNITNTSFGTLNDIGILMINEGKEDNPLPNNYWYQ